MKCRLLSLLLFATTSVMAQTEINPAVAEQQQSANALFQRAMNLYRVGSQSTNLDDRINQLTASGQSFEFFINAYPAHERYREAEYYRAICYYHTGDLENAKRLFASIILAQRKGPYVAAAASVLAQDAFEKKDYATASTLFSKLSANAEKTEDRHRGYYYEAICQHYQKFEKQALQCYEKILNEEGAEASPYVHLCRKAAGILRMNAGDHQNALLVLQALRKSLAPEEYRAEAALYSGVCCLKMNDDVAAEQHFQEVLRSTNPAWLSVQPDALTYVMQMRYNRKEYAEVIQLFRANPSNTNDSRQARRFQIVARSMMRLKRYLDAIPIFLDVIKLAEGSELAFDASYYRLMCFYLLDGRNIPQQVDVFTEIYGTSHKSHPRIHTALMLKAAALQEEGKIEEAAETFRLVEESRIAAGSRANMLYNRGWCLSLAKDYQGAIRSLSRFIDNYKEDVRSADALALRGDCRHKTGDRMGALEDFTKLIQLNPSAKLASVAWQKSALIHKDQKEYASMIKCYQTLLEMLPDALLQAKANAHFWIGHGYNKLQEHEKAIPHLVEARKMEGKTYRKNAGLLLISSHFSLENIDELCAEIDTSIEGGYSHEVSPAMVSWAGIQSLSLEKAEQASRFFLMIANPLEPRGTPRDVWRNLSRAQILSKDYKGALKSVDHFLTVEKKPLALAGAMFDQALCHLKLGKHDEAKRALDSGFAQNPQGILKAEGEILLGDYYMAVKKPALAQELFVANAKILEDQRLKPIALQKLIEAMEANQQGELADEYREQLETLFPQKKSKE